MSDKDGITGDVRSREVEFFRRKDRELVEKLRKASESSAARAALEASSGIHDPGDAAGAGGARIHARHRQPAPHRPNRPGGLGRGGVSDSERALIVQFARERGVAAGSAADQQLQHRLVERPSKRSSPRHRSSARCSTSPRAERDAERLDDLVHRCEQLAAASGGILGFGKFSSEERALLGRIPGALKGR